MSDSIILYHYWSSTCSQKARFALEEKGVPWASRHLDLFKFEHWEDDYVSINPDGMVPTLVDGDTVITDSNIMLEYLDERSSASRLSPDSAAQRAVMRHWMKLADSAQKSVIKIGYNLRIKPRMGHFSHEQLQEIGRRNPNSEFRRSWFRKLEQGVSQAEIDHSYAQLELLVDRIEQTVSRVPWLAGDTFSLADIALSPYLKRIEVLERPEMLDGSRRPHLASWWHMLQQRPAFVEAYSFPNPNPADPIPA
ncbi:MAG: glutathione S-transferase family protein [Gammaproteobacteria bacterium]|nr:glutathione S-transferase family protein [Gammaproteobacteria bacterium]